MPIQFLTTILLSTKTTKLFLIAQIIFNIINIIFNSKVVSILLNQIIIAVKMNEIINKRGDIIRFCISILISLKEKPCFAKKTLFFIYYLSPFYENPSSYISCYRNNNACNNGNYFNRS